MTPTTHKSLADALAAFQGECPTLAKDATNPHFKSKFTPLDTMVETVAPLLSKHGLSWSAFPCFATDGSPALRYVLRHAASGEVESEVMPLLVTKSDPQGMGSAITYARRYSLAAVLNLVADDDDDGNAASRPAAARGRANGSNGGEVVSAEDIKALQVAAEGLKPDAIKLAMTACGIPIPDPFVWNQVPKAKSVALAKALAGTERPS